MAAFDTTSRIIYRPYDATTEIDIRRSRLPSLRVTSSEYEPLDHRNPAKPIKLWMAYFNLLRTMCGAGVLGMPQAISQAGIVLGPALLLSTGAVLIYTHLLLLDCLCEVSRQLKIPYISYRYGFRLAVLHGPPILRCVGKYGPHIIASFMLMSQLGICTVCVTFTADSLRDMMDWQSNRPALLALLLPYLLLEFFMKSLSIVSYVSFVGNLLNLVGMAIVFHHIFSDPAGELIKATTEFVPFLFAVGTLLFNLSAVGVILALDKSLKDARKMRSKFGVITVGICVTTLVSLVFGCLGYNAFGTMEENILRSLPFDETTSIVAIGLYLVTVALSYPIQCYPAIAVIIEVIKYGDSASTPSEHTLHVVETIARPLFVIMSFIIGYFVPFQGPFVAFVGNACTSMLSLVFPALMDLCLRYPDDFGVLNICLFKNLIIIGAGLLTASMGVYFGAYLIYVRLLSFSSPNTRGFY